MALSKLVFKPGINRDQTNYASEGGWIDCDKVRFRSGFPEKIGGWVVQTFQQYVGAARSLFPWTTTDGNTIIGIGTNEKVYVNPGTTLHDITPIRASFATPNTNNCFGTTNTSNEVLVTINAHGALEGDYVIFSGVVGPIGGIPQAEFNAEFKIFDVTPNTFKITTTSAATSTTTGGGTAIDADFLISIGNEVAVAGYGWGTSTWSRGTWGSSSSSAAYLPPRLIFQEKFNNDLIFNIRGGDIYYWVYTNAFNTRAVLLSSISGAVATPQQVTKVMFAPTGHLLALGCTNFDAANGANDYLGSYDPLLIRWANVDSYIGPEPENWRPEVSNTAGFLRIQSGSKIVTAIRTRQEVFILTDLSAHSLQFLGTEEVFKVEELSAALSIVGPNAITGGNNIIYWMGNDKFYTYSGRIDTLPCTIRQYVFEDINTFQFELVVAGVNAEFNEVIWFYASGESNTINRYAVYNYAENIWYYGQLSRTAWVDSGTTPNPVAAYNGWLYSHELGRDDGQPLGAEPLPIESYIQSADVDIDDGDKFMLIRRVIPDVNFVGSETSNPVTGAPLVPQAYMTVGVRNFPGAAVSTTNASDLTTTRDVTTACSACSPTTAIIDQYTNQVFVRARGRQMSFKIGSDDVGVQWQLGMPRVDARPDGSRG